MRITISEIVDEVRKALSALPTSRTGPSGVNDRASSAAAVLQRLFFLLITSPSSAFELYGEALARKAALVQSYLTSIRALYGESYLGGLPVTVPGIENISAVSQKLVRAASGLSRFELIGAGDGVSGQFLNSQSVRFEEVAQQLIHTVRGLSEREAQKRLREQTLAMDTALAAISLSDLNMYVQDLIDIYLGSGTLPYIIRALQIGLMKGNYELVTNADVRDDAGQLVVKSMVAKVLVETLTSKANPVGEIILPTESMSVVDDDLIVQSAGGFTVLDTVLDDGLKVSTDSQDPRVVRVSPGHQLAHRMRVRTVDTPFYSSLSGNTATLYPRLVVSDYAARYSSGSELSSSAAKSADILPGDYVWSINDNGDITSATVDGVNTDEGVIKVKTPSYSQPNTYASVLIPGVSTPDGDLMFTSKIEGRYGNSYRVWFVVDGGISSSPLTVVDGYQIYFYIDALPWPGADVVADTINNDPAASQLVLATATGTGVPGVSDGEHYDLSGAINPSLTIAIFRPEYAFFTDERVTPFVQGLYGVRAIFTHPEDGEREVFIENGDESAYPDVTDAVRTSGPLGTIHVDPTSKLPVTLENVPYEMFEYPRSYSLLNSTDDSLYSLSGSRVRIGTVVKFSESGVSLSAGVQDVLSLHAFTIKPVVPPGEYWALFSDFARAGDVFVVDGYGRFSIVEVLGPQTAIVSPQPPAGMTLVSAKLVTADSVRYTRRLRDSGVDFLAAGVEAGHALVANFDTGSITSKVMSVTPGMLTVESPLPVDLKDISYEVRRRIDDRTSWVDVSSTTHVEPNDTLTLEGYPSHSIAEIQSSTRLTLRGGLPTLEEVTPGVITRGGAEGYSGYVLSQQRLFSDQAVTLRDPDDFRQKVGALLFDLGTEGSVVLGGSDARFQGLGDAHDRVLTDEDLSVIRFGDNLYLTIDGDQKVVHVLSGERGILSFFPPVEGSSVDPQFSVKRNEISDALYELRQIELAAVDVLSVLESYLCPKNTGARSLLEGLRNSGFDRAIDLLLEGDFSELALGGQAALSYASKLEEAIAQSVAVLGAESDLVLLDPREDGPVGGSRV